MTRKPTNSLLYTEISNCPTVWLMTSPLQLYWLLTDWTIDQIHKAKTHEDILHWFLRPLNIWFNIQLPDFATTPTTAWPFGCCMPGPSSSRNGEWLWQKFFSPPEYWNNSVAQLIFSPESMTYGRTFLNSSTSGNSTKFRRQSILIVRIQFPAIVKW